MKFTDDNINNDVQTFDEIFGDIWDLSLDEEEYEDEEVDSELEALFDVDDELIDVENLSYNNDETELQDISGVEFSPEIYAYEN